MTSRLRSLLDLLHVVPLLIGAQMLGLVFVSTGFGLVAAFLAARAREQGLPVGPPILALYAPQCFLMAAFAVAVVGSLALRVADGCLAVRGPRPRAGWALAVALGPGMIAQAFWWLVARREGEEPICLPPCEDERRSRREEGLDAEAY